MLLQLLAELRRPREKRHMVHGAKGLRGEEAAKETRSPKPSTLNRRFRDILSSHAAMQLRQHSVE